MVPLVDQSGKSERFTCTPIDTFLIGDRLLASFENLDELGSKIAIRRKYCDLVANLFEGLHHNTSFT